MAALLGCIALAACADGLSTKAGGAVDEVVTLTIGTDEFPSRIGADQISDFAHRVHELSGGTVRLEPVWNASGGVRQWDQRVARMVVSGELDMGLIPARAWDTEGVSSMRALHAPFLVTSSELLEEVLSGDMTGLMLGGLESIGLTGLGLLPEAMRYAISYGPPLTTPASFHGLTVRAPWSATSFTTFEALGASPVDLNGDELIVAVANSTVDALESGLEFRTFRNELRANAVVGDLVLWPKVNTLVVNGARFERLSEPQQEWLRQAAAGATSHAWTEHSDEASLTRGFCDGGGEIVLVGDDVRDQFIEAATPVYHELERDELTARLIAEIRELADQVTVDPRSAAAPCHPNRANSIDDASQTSTATTSDAPVDTSDPPPDTSVDPPDPALDGVYRVEWTEAWLREIVEPHVDTPTLNRILWQDVGVWQLTFDGGRFEMWKVGETERCNGTYTTSQGRVLITASTQLEPRCDNDADTRFLVDARYEIVGSELRLSDFQLSDEVDYTWWYALFGGIAPQRTA